MPGQPAAIFDWFSYTGADPAFNAIGRGDYANPILAGFYPDPSVIRVGSDFYLVNSSFAYFPGIPVFHSRDLVHWTQLGNAIDRPGQLDFTGLGVSRGVFAPSISYHDGRFYIVNTCVDCGGNFVITARDPAGPWSDPVWLKDVGGIDPSLFVDADGSAWLVNNDNPAGGPLYDGHRAIWIRRFDLARLATSGPAKMIVDGGVDIATRPVWVEGPHIFRHDGRYFLIAAEGGTGPQHSETVYRADRPDGPFAAYPHPILTQRDLGPGRASGIGSAGHAQLVDTPGGDWWATFLAVRPYRDDYYNIGRETFLLPVKWRDGWPIITDPGTRIGMVQPRPRLLSSDAGATPLGGNFTLRDDFGGRDLALYWLTPRTPNTRWWRIADGSLIVTPRADRIGTLGQPSFVARRQQHLVATATTALRFASVQPGAKAGLVAYQDEAHYYFVGIANVAGRRVVRVERRANAGDNVDGVVLAERPIVASGAPIRLRISARRDRYDFAYALPGGRWQPLLADADGTILSTKTAGGFVGTTIGMYAYTPGVSR